VVFGPVARACGLPLVFWAHDVPRGTHWLERWARRTPPDLVVANSRYTAAALPALFPDRPVETLYAPVANSAPQPRDAARRHMRKEFNTRDDATVIISACRLERWKGHEVLLRALGQLQTARSWECWLAGGAQRPHEAAYLQELQQLAGALGLGSRVRFLGQRSDVPRLLAAADIHCQPNTGPEPFGIAFVEAMYAGLPVVTTAIGGGAEVVDDSCGVLTPPADPGAVAAALAGLVDNDARRAQLGRAAPDVALRLCDPSSQLRQLHELVAPLARAHLQTV
jgi:glycosyltransferase involved in cell wall biosynthesis